MNNRELMAQVSPELESLGVLGMNDFPDWQARAASEARDEQRRHPRPYPSTERERLEIEYTPETEEPKNEQEN